MFHIPTGIFTARNENGSRLSKPTRELSSNIFSMVSNFLLLASLWAAPADFAVCSLLSILPTQTSNQPRAVWGRVWSASGWRLPHLTSLHLFPFEILILFLSSRSFNATCFVFKSRNVEGSQRHYLASKKQLIYVFMWLNLFAIWII